MHISCLHLKNYKRFNDLTIDLSVLDEPPKLVLLIGANGSGKSSIFDAFGFIAQPLKEGFLVQKELSYYKKIHDQPLSIAFKANGKDYLVGEQTMLITLLQKIFTAEAP